MNEKLVTAIALLGAAAAMYFEMWCVIFAVGGLIYLADYGLDAVADRNLSKRADRVAADQLDMFEHLKPGEQKTTRAFFDEENTDG